MTIGGINIEQSIRDAREVIEADKTLSTSMRTVCEMLLLVISLLSDRLGMNSKNSSKPPSADPNREKNPRGRSTKKVGGQQGHVGKTLIQYDDPDHIHVIKLDKRTLPKGQYTPVGFERRQVVDIEIKRSVTEYQAESWKDKTGAVVVAPFPEGVTGAIQYGHQVKAHAVYLSQYQLLPYNRIEEYFSDQLGIPLSAGTIFNFNRLASALLVSSGIEEIIKGQLRKTTCLHADETGINVNGDRQWLHCASDLSWTYLFPHERRGTAAINEMGILPDFKGVVCHDHWKPYYRYTECIHALCNAHHLRELEFAWEKDDQGWAKDMQALLIKINKKVNDNGGELTKPQSAYYRKKYRELLLRADIECPPAEHKPPKRGRQKKSKSRNLLERLREFENDVLRFMTSSDIPFTNNQGERDIRMTKVQQKISGCFRSTGGAVNFCRIRSYLSTCKKQNVTATYALATLFSGQRPSIFEGTTE